MEAAQTGPPPPAVAVVAAAAAAAHAARECERQPAALGGAGRAGADVWRLARARRRRRPPLRLCTAPPRPGQAGPRARRAGPLPLLPLRSLLARRDGEPLRHPYALLRRHGDAPLRLVQPLARRQPRGSRLLPHPRIDWRDPARGPHGHVHRRLRHAAARVASNPRPHGCVLLRWRRHAARASNPRPHGRVLLR
eukprot:3035833-Prymnesium_polylepis.1